MRIYLRKCNFRAIVTFADRPMKLSHNDYR
jgi:hypothetical protein